MKVEFTINGDAQKVTLLPIDQREFLRVKGMGPARWERFGPKVVQISLMARAVGHPPRATGSSSGYSTSKPSPHPGRWCRISGP